MSGAQQARDRYDEALRLALDEAERTSGSGDVPVGAVVLDPAGTVIGAGHNEREATGDPTAHAEVLALREAAAHAGAWRLTGCTLAVTLEPCTMCAGAIVLARVDRLVYGARDPKAGAVGSLWDVVRDRRLNHRPEVIPPDLVGPDVAARCGAVITEFFALRRLR
ncbi:tRNA(adenine34) deaminase [Spinactinospora alkalitolerans]|uniref:tRNA-specific adenosine deaminase n=1 Tax=Spinactinospora alkalitolerans TaxID=687207 RepID=A0A852U546_9ACTN|nr:nucleoside deaminase [Spinactinospora alkalitolerans]NYE50632.1 tRNA(adenine34) deaminase [Spinactinospora alkalitolerans]